jgi:hypothetical protein
MSQDANGRVADTAADQDVYDYRRGILRSLHGRGGAASLGEVKRDIAGEAGDGVSLQCLENARLVLVDEGTLYTELRWTTGLSGRKQRAVFLVLPGRPSRARVIPP